MIAPFRQSDPTPGESIFVYGPDETANSTLVVALALRRQHTFSWADCSIPTSSGSVGVREPLSRGIPRPSPSGVSKEDLVARSWSAASLERLLVPENRLDSLHLLSYLSLPSLLQELAALSTSPAGESIVFLANIDALDPALRASVLGQAVVHSRLHSEAVTLFVTSCGRPTPREELLFDQVLRLELPPAGTWVDGSLHIDKGSTGSTDGGLQIRRVWELMGLDPTLLPPLGSRPGAPVDSGAPPTPGKYPGKSTGSAEGT